MRSPAFGWRGVAVYERPDERVPKLKPLLLDAHEPRAFGCLDRIGSNAKRRPGWCEDPQITTSLGGGGEEREPFVTVQRSQPPPEQTPCRLSRWERLGEERDAAAHERRQLEQRERVAGRRGDDL